MATRAASIARPSAENQAAGIDGPPASVVALPMATRPDGAAARLVRCAQAGAGVSARRRVRPSAGGANRAHAAAAHPAADRQRTATARQRPVGAR